MALEPSHPFKILLRSPNWVGDAVMATPVPRALKRTFPQCHIHVLARDWVAPLWERHPEVEKVIPLKEGRGFRSWWQQLLPLRETNYDIGLVLPNSFSSAWLQYWVGSPHRVGYATEGRTLLLTVRVPWGPGAEQLPRPQTYLNLARAAGADVDFTKDWAFTLKVSSEELEAADQRLGPEPEGFRIGLAPGSVAPSRRWPSERYAQLADRLVAQGHQVVLLGSKGDQAIAQAVARSMQRPALNTAGETKLREVIALIKRLDFVVSNDSGAMHLAYAQGIPLLVLQGAADPLVTGPFGPNSSVLRDENLACAPCVRNECNQSELKCMLHLTVDQVAAKLDTLLVPLKPTTSKPKVEK